MSNQYEKLNQFVFTLSEDNPPEQQPISSATVSAEATTGTDTKPEWERSLEKLRQNKKKRDGQLIRHEEIKSVTPSVTAYKTRRQQYSFDAPATTMGKVAESSAYTAPNHKNKKTSQPNNEILLDPVQRERVYRAYLKQWQQQTILEAQQQESALNDTALLIQEDWLAAQSCLQSAPVDETLPSSCTIRLKGNQSSVLQTQTSQQDMDSEQPDTAEDSEPAIHVHMHVIEPRGMANKAVTCISEQALLQQLSEKLRPHLADVLSGMVRVAVQKHTAGLVTTLQRELLAEVPAAVEDILKHNLAQVMNNFKKKQR